MKPRGRPRQWHPDRQRCRRLSAVSSTRPSLRRKLGFTLGAIVAGLALLVWITAGIRNGIRSGLAAIQAAGEPMDAASLDAWVGHLPESKNGAIRVLELVDGFRGVDNVQGPRRARSWDATNLAWASTERARVQSWRIDMHTALQARKFRYPLVVTNGFAGLDVPHLASLKSAAATLAFWASHSAAIHQPDESATALLDGLRLARSLDDEPILISWLVRVAYLTMMSIGTENALTLGPLPEARLAELQSAFLDADRPNTLTRALISERALGFEGCQSSPSEYVKLTLAPPGTAFGTP